jgi:hypothetical protein
MSFCVCIEKEFCVRHIEGESGKKTGEGRENKGIKERQTKRQPESNKWPNEQKSGKKTDVER